MNQNIQVFPACTIDGGNKKMKRAKVIKHFKQQLTDVHFETSEPDWSIFI